MQVTPWTVTTRARCGAVELASADLQVAGPPSSSRSLAAGFRDRWRRWAIPYCTRWNTLDRAGTSVRSRAKPGVDQLRQLVAHRRRAPRHRLMPTPGRSSSASPTIETRASDSNPHRHCRQQPSLSCSRSVVSGTAEPRIVPATPTCASGSEHQPDPDVRDAGARRHQQPAQLSAHQRQRASAGALQYSNGFLVVRSIN